jgi:hypothetical protein
MILPALPTLGGPISIAGPDIPSLSPPALHYRRSPTRNTRKARSRVAGYLYLGRAACTEREVLHGHLPGVCVRPGYCATGGYYASASGDIQGFAAADRNGTWGKATEIPGLAALGTHQPIPGSTTRAHHQQARHPRNRAVR